MIADRVPDPSYVASLTRLRVAAGALYRDRHGRVLVVQPAYKDTAEIPGGALEPGESPWQACHREVQEELGVELPVGDLVCVDWTPPQPHWDSALMIIFDGGELNEGHTGAIRLTPGGEISSWRFVMPEELDEIMVPRLAQRIQACLARTTGGIYLEAGHPPASRAAP